MKHLYIFWLNVFVYGGQSVVDKTTVVEGQTFTITCDHLHVNGTIPSCRFLFLEVFKDTGAGVPKVIITLQHGTFNNINIPNHWMKDCKNPKNSFNATQFHCKLIVNDAKISDSGQYGCLIVLACPPDLSPKFVGLSDVVVTKDNTTNSEASSIFCVKTTIGLYLMMITATQL